MYRSGNAVVRWCLFVFGDKGAEQSVPDDQSATVVAVDLAGVAAMVNPVMAGGVEHGFHPAWQFANQRGVNEKLVHQ